MLVLVLAVVGMHALGMGHASSMTTMSVSSSSTATEAGDAPTFPMPAAAVPADDAAVPPPPLSILAWHDAMVVASTCDLGCVSLSEHPRSMSDGMCLAILPVLILLLLALWSCRGAGNVGDRADWRGHQGTRPGRAPPAHLTPSLSKLCVLRI